MQMIPSIINERKEILYMNVLITYDDYIIMIIHECIVVIFFNYTEQLNEEKIE